MQRTLLLVGTRKGCFLLESDADRKDWSVRGPFCESWPVYHAVHDAATGAIYAAAASEWFGLAVWRSPDLGETWTHSSEGIGRMPNRRAAAEAVAAGGGTGRRSAGGPKACRIGMVTSIAICSY